MSNPRTRPSGPLSRVRAPLIGTLVLAGVAFAGVSWRSALEAPLREAASAALLTPAAIAAVTMMVLAVLLVRRTRRVRRQRTHSALVPVDGLPVGGAVQERDAGTAGEDTDTRTERVLRLQVHSLEQALGGQDQRLAEVVREGQRHAMLTVVALRQSLAHERGEIGLTRVEAALGRIGTAPSFTRPALTTGPSGTPPVAFAVPQPLRAELADSPAPMTVRPTIARTGTGTAVDTDLDCADGADHTAVVEDPATLAARATASPVPRVVRPVPALVRRETPHRSRRRLRRTVAA